MNVSQAPVSADPEGVQRLLSLAEKIRSDIDKEREELDKLHFFAISAAAFMALIAGLVGLSGLPGTDLKNPAWIVLVGVTFLIILMLEFFVGRTVRARLRENRHTLDDTLNILHEATSVIGRYIGMNPLEEVEFRIRLSRLGGGAGLSVSTRRGMYLRPDDGPAAN